MKLFSSLRFPRTHPRFRMVPVDPSSPRALRLLAKQRAARETLDAKKS